MFVCQTMQTNKCSLNLAEFTIVYVRQCMCSSAIIHVCVRVVGVMEEIKNEEEKRKYYYSL